MTSPLEQKKRRHDGAVVVTANRVADGAVVYRTASQGWTRDLNAAALWSGSRAAAELARASADDVAIVGPYLAPASHGPDARIVPGNLRERIRVGGPTFALPGAA